MTHIVGPILNLSELSCFPLDAFSEIGLKSRPPYLKLNLSVTFCCLVKSHQRKRNTCIHILLAGLWFSSSHASILTERMALLVFHNKGYRKRDVVKIIAKNEEISVL